MNKYIYNVLALAFMTGAAAPGVMAQGSAEADSHGYTPAALEVLKEQRLWFHSTNAAGAVLDNKQNYSTVEIAYDQTAGNFHRPQQGKSVNNAGVDCEGFMNLGSALVWGEFSFKQRNINESQFNASIVDPYRGMPFFYADDHKSDWRNQYYDMRFRASTPLYWNKLAVGIEGSYHAVLAAKQLDPRVDSRYFELGLHPALVYAINGGNSVGAVFHYEAIKEDSRMSNVNMTIPQTYYLLYGLGMANKLIGDGNSSDYHGHVLGGGLQYNFRAGIVDGLVSGDFNRHVENMDNLKFSGATVPETRVGIKDDNWAIKLQLQARGEKWTNRFGANVTLRDINGLQYINEFNDSETDPGWNNVSHDVRSNFKTQSGGVDYSIIRNRGYEYAWRIDAGVGYHKQKDEYFIPEARKQVHGWDFHGDAKYNFAIGQKMNRRLLAEVNGAMMLPGRCGYTYSDVIPDYPTVTELEVKDTDYLSAKWASVGASVTYSQQFKSVNRMNGYARAEFTYTKTNHKGYDHRRYVGVALGVTF